MADKEDKHRELCLLHTPPPSLHVITLNRRASQVHGYDWRDTVINKVTDTMATGEAKWNASSYCKGQNLLSIYSSERLCPFPELFCTNTLDFTWSRQVCLLGSRDSVTECMCIFVCVSGSLCAYAFSYIKYGYVSVHGEASWIDTNILTVNSKMHGGKICGIL